MGRRRQGRQILGTLAALALCWPAAAQQRPDALSAGLTAFQSGHYGEAAVLLQEHLEHPGEDAESVALARHALGRSLNELGQWAQAAEVLARAVAEPEATALVDHLEWQRARALTGLGHHGEAAETYARIGRDPWSPFAARAGYYEALGWEATGDAERARRALSRFLAARSESPLAQEARIRLATLEAARGREARAKELYHEVSRLAPGSRAALEHGSLPGGAGVPDLDELEWLIGERRFEEARAPLEALREDARAARERATETRALELLARVARETGQIQEALDLYAALERRGSRPTSWERLASLHARLGDHKRAERMIGKAHRGRRSRAYWHALGDLRMQSGRYPECERAYRKALGRRRDALLQRRVAWCTLRQPAKVDHALELLGEVRERQSRFREWARYWGARALQDAGRTEEALAAFRGLIQDAPLHYYGAQAYSRAAEITGTAPVPHGATTGSLLGAIAAGEDAVAGWQPAPQSTVHWTADLLHAAWDAAPVAADRAEQIAALERLAARFGEVAPEAHRALELARLGLVSEAAAELRVIDADLRTQRRRGWRSLIDRARADLLDNRREKKARGGASLRDLGRRGRKAARAFYDATRDGLRAELRVAQVALGDTYALRRSVMESGGLGREPSEATLQRWRDAYPIAHPGAMASFTRQAGVPPYFLYSVMTVESAFHPHAISVSDAYGLLQVIPRTGRRVASELGYAEFSPELLLEPEVAIYMGSYYLGRVLRRFQGQEPLAAAAYNAGPHRVATWLETNADRPMDAFIEEIPYRQTRRYTRSVLGHMARYRRIYHGERGMYVSNRLVADYLPTPNY